MRAVFGREGVIVAHKFDGFFAIACFGGDDAVSGDRDWASGLWFVIDAANGARQIMCSIGVRFMEIIDCRGVDIVCFERRTTRELSSSFG